MRRSIPKKQNVTVLEVSWQASEALLGVTNGNQIYMY